MPYTDPERNRIFRRLQSRRLRAADPEKYRVIGQVKSPAAKTKRRAYSKAYLRALTLARRELLAIIKDAPCEHCGEQLEQERMHWHHRDPATYVFRLSGWSQPQWTERQLIQELRKVDLLCYRCHRDEHEALRKEGAA